MGKGEFRNLEIELGEVSFGILELGELSFAILKKKIQIRPVNHCVFLDIDNQRIYLLISLLSWFLYGGFCRGTYLFHNNPSS